MSRHSQNIMYAVRKISFRNICSVKEASWERCAQYDDMPERTVAQGPPRRVLP